MKRVAGAVKAARLKADSAAPNPFIDAAECQRDADNGEKRFREALAREKGR